MKILDEKVLKTDTEIRNLYKDCKYVYIIDSYDKVTDDELNWESRKRCKV